MKKEPTQKGQSIKIIRRRVWILLLIGAGAAYYLLPFKVRKVLPAVEFTLGGDEAILRSVVIQGTYYHNLFSEDEFQGTIEIDGYAVTKLPLWRKLSVSLKEEQEAGYELSQAKAFIPEKEYELTKESFRKDYPFSLVYSSNGMNRLVIERYEHFVHGDNETAFFSELEGTYIIVGFQNREEAETWLMNVKGWNADSIAEMIEDRN